MLVGASCLHAASVKGGRETLRELVVVPRIDLRFGYFAYANRANFLEDHMVPGEIDHLRKDVKEHPEEPEGLLRLGALLNRTGRTNEARGYFERGEKAAKKKSELQPSDGPTLVLRADALINLGRKSEVESLLRRATQVSSNEWKCWAGLGRYLGDNALNEILPTQVKGSSASDEAVISAAAKYQPPSELLAKAEAMRKESEACYDKAVALAPKEPDAYLDRANIEGSYAMFDFLGRFYRDRQSPKQSEVLQLRCSAATVRGLKEAARLCPDDEHVAMAAAWLEAFHAVLEVGQRDTSYDLSSWKSLPENARNSLRQAMGHLEVLSRTANKSRSAGAFQSLGILKMMTQDWTGAIGDFHRALALEPVREKAWEGLLGAQVGSGASPEELVTTCKGLVKNKDCCRSRLFLAKALIRQNKFDEAKVEIKKSADLEPNNILSYLFAGALLLKLTDDENNLSYAVSQMTSAKEVLDKMPDDSEKSARWREFMLNGAILSGLLDKPAEAKDWLRPVLKYCPDDQTAKDILSAIQ
jgi:tetratricopeptide (TPR) repeat protein